MEEIKSTRERNKLWTATCVYLSERLVSVKTDNINEHQLWSTNDGNHTFFRCGSSSFGAQKREKKHYAKHAGNGQPICIWTTQRFGRLCKCARFPSASSNFKLNIRPTSNSTENGCLSFTTVYFSVISKQWFLKSIQGNSEVPSRSYEFHVCWCVYSVHSMLARGLDKPIPSVKNYKHFTLKRIDMEKLFVARNIKDNAIVLLAVESRSKILFSLHPVAIVMLT